MKVIIPSFSPPDSFVDNVSHTLRQMGHEVLTMSRQSNRWINSPVPRMLHEFHAKLRPNEPSTNEAWLLKNTPLFRPDLLLCLTQSLRGEVLADVKKMGVGHRVAWWGDSPANMKGMGLLTAEWDWVFVKDPLAVAKIRRLGLNANLMHEAMNPDWHKPLAVRSNESVVIAGTFYGYRQALTTELIRHGVEVGLYGGRLPAWVDPKIRQRHTGRFVEREEKSRVFGEALACLNSTAMSEGNSLNCRAFEIAGAGGLQLLEQREIVNECFEPGKELLVFDSIPELMDLISRAKVDRAWASGIREAGACRALAQHTYKHRLEVIFRSLAGGRAVA